MFLAPPEELEWLEPWCRLEDNDQNDVWLVKELQKEICSQHVLYGLSVMGVARRGDNDDVLFATSDPISPLAVVHLTWTGRRESDPHWPSTTLYKDWQDWIQRCLLPDHEDH